MTSLFSCIWRGSTIVLFTILVLGTQKVFAFEVPANDGFVTIDFAAGSEATVVMSADEQAALELALQEYKNKTSNEIAVVVVQTLGSEPIEDVALQIARKWGIGSKENNNGILLLVAYDERQVRFEIGYGLEGAVPDIVAKGIIDTDIVPNFRDGNYYAGIVQAVESLQRHIAGEYTADRYVAEEGEVNGAVFFFGFLLLQWMFAILSRTKSWWLGGIFGGAGGLILAGIYNLWLSIPFLVVAGLLLDYVVSKNYQKRGKTSWWAGGGFGPGGGFGGGRGGGFGGGGASGRW